MDKIKVGNFIHDKRTEKNLTQEELGELLSVSNKTVSRWECGIFLPPVEQLYALSELFQVSVDEILSGEEKKAEDKKEIQPGSNMNKLKQIETIERKKEWKDSLLRKVLFPLAGICYVFPMLSKPNTYPLIGLLSFIALSLALLPIKKIRKENTYKILELVDYALIAVVPSVFEILFISGQTEKSQMLLVILSIVGMMISLVLLILEGVSLSKHKFKERAYHEENEKKHGIIAVSVASVLTVCSIVCFTFLNIGLISDYRVGSYYSSSIQDFLSENSMTEITYVTTHYTDYTDNDHLLKEKLQSMEFTVLDNPFPHQDLKDYQSGKEFIRFKDKTLDELCIYLDTQTVRYLDRVSLQGNIINFYAYHYYSISKESADSLRDIVLSLSEKGGQL